MFSRNSAFNQPAPPPEPIPGIENTARPTREATTKVSSVDVSKLEEWSSEIERIASYNPVDSDAMELEDIAESIRSYLPG